jgi:ABC-type phosphate/phosphonate transport system ATPase subunit
MIGHVKDLLSLIGKEAAGKTSLPRYMIERVTCGDREVAFCHTRYFARLQAEAAYKWNHTTGHTVTVRLVDTIDGETLEECRINSIRTLKKSTTPKKKSTTPKKKSKRPRTTA